MRLNYLAMLSVASLLTVSAGTFVTPMTVLANPCAAKTNPCASKPNPCAAKTAAPGTFVTVDSPTQGTARIVTDKGRKYLELDKSFSTKEAPDLYVLLHRSQTPNSYQQGEYVNLGKLQRLQGTQRYAIPASVKLADYRSVVIWCRQFDVTMGVASLNSGVAAQPNPCAAKPNPCAAKPNPCAGR